MLRSSVVCTFIASALSAIALPTVAAPIEGLPSTYVPGTPVTFELRLPAIADLGAYNVDLVLQSGTGLAGADFFFDVPATMPASVNYVFSSTANFFDAANVDSLTTHRITLSDFQLAGVNVVPNINDRVATVVIGTSPTFGGSLEISIDESGLILDTHDASPTPVQNFEQVKSDFTALGRISLVPVPEPSGLAGMLIATCCGIGCRLKKTSR